MKLFQALIIFLLSGFSAAFIVPFGPASLAQRRTSARSCSAAPAPDPELADKVIRVVGKQLGKEGLVTVESNFIDDLDADSLDTIELIMSLEEEFGIDIAEEDAQKMVCVKDAVDYIASKK